MPGMTSLDSDEYPDDFANSVAGDISSELFPSEESSSLDVPEGAPALANAKSEEPAPAAAPQGQETPPSVVPGQNSVSKPLPKSWKKDMAPIWEKADPSLHEYVYAREADMMRGIQQYAQGHQQWDALIRPYAPIFQQNPNVQPVQLMHSLMNTHLQLLNPNLPSEKKAELAKNILSDYGIDFSAVQQAPSPAPQDPRVQLLEQRLAQMERESQLSAERAYAAGVAEQQKAVAAFAQDPKNKYFSEVQNDILRFIQAGVADDLPSAYELACAANPAVRAKMLAEQQAGNVQPPNTQPARAKNGQFINLDGDPPKTARTRKGSIDNTIDEIVSSHFSKH